MLYWFNGAAFASTGLRFRGRKNVLTWRSNGTALYVNLNGATATLTALTAASMTKINLGTFDGGAPKGTRIYETILYSSDIGAANQTALHSYLYDSAGLTPDSTKTVCWAGDSLTAGVGSEHGVRPSDYVTDRPNSTWYVFGNDGGFAYLNPIPSAANAVAIKGSAEGIYHLWLGTNDINGGTRTGLQTAAALKAWSDTVRAGGGKVIVYKLQDFPLNEIERLACNAQIAVDTASYDAIVDLPANAALSDCTNTTYFTSDQVHLTDAGYAVVGGLAQTAQAAL
jgi:lysophospholipase L1-like esterase